MGQRARSDGRSKPQTRSEDNTTPLSFFLVDERFRTERENPPLSGWKVEGDQAAARAPGGCACLRPGTGSGAKPQAHSHPYGNAAGCRGSTRGSVVLPKRGRGAAPSAQALAFAALMGSPAV